jgi:hypothetical protein
MTPLGSRRFSNRSLGSQAYVVIAAPASSYVRLPVVSKLIVVIVVPASVLTSASVGS